MNLELYDEWKDTDAVKLAIYFLDAVLSEFIDKTEGNYYLQGARNFAMRHRALGFRCIRIPLLSAKEYDSIRKFRGYPIQCKSIQTY